MTINLSPPPDNCICGCSKAYHIGKPQGCNRHGIHDFNSDKPNIGLKIYNESDKKSTYVIYDEDYTWFYAQREGSDIPVQIERSTFSNMGWRFVPKKKQVGGTHYTDLAIQPWEVITRNKMGFFDGNALKYIMRFRDKNGVEDLKKAIHYLEELIRQEESAQG